MNFAIFETGGKQYRVKEGDVVFVEKLDVEVGQAVNFDRVLAVSNGDNLTVGAPMVQGAQIVGKVVEHGKEKKIFVFKYHAKSNYRKRYGHRQPFTKVTIEKIEA